MAECFDCFETDSLCACSWAYHSGERLQSCLDGRLIRLRDFIKVMVELNYLPDPLCGKPAVEASLALIARDIKTCKDCRSIIEFVAKYEEYVKSNSALMASDITVIPWFDFTDDERQMILSLWKKNKTYWVLYSSRVKEGIAHVRAYNISLLVDGESLLKAEEITHSNFTRSPTVLVA
jgi:hypothetical protein